jgi:hypothetical protein
MPPKRFKAEDNIFTPNVFEFGDRQETVKLQKIASTMNNMAYQVATNESRIRN